MSKEELTPESIVDMLGNIANRHDIRVMKSEQAKLIEEYANIKVAMALDHEWEAIGQWKPYLHHCMDWDGLLIDEHDGEFEACQCFDKKPVKASQPLTVFNVVSDGPCGMNHFDSFLDLHAAEAERDRLNETRTGWDKTYIWTVDAK